MDTERRRCCLSQSTCEIRFERRLTPSVPKTDIIRSNERSSIFQLHFDNKLLHLISLLSVVLLSIPIDYQRQSIFLSEKKKVFNS